MSSSEVMSTVAQWGAKFDNQEMMNLEIFMHFTKAGWNFSHGELTPGGTPLVVYFDKVLKFAGLESGKPTDYANTCADWTSEASGIISKYMTEGTLVLQFIWEQERVTYHVVRPSSVKELSPYEIFDRYIPAFIPSN